MARTLKVHCSPVALPLSKTFTTKTIPKISDFRELPDQDIHILLIHFFFNWKPFPHPSPGKLDYAV